MQLEHIKKIIHSCVNIEQLEVTRRWIDNMPLPDDSRLDLDIQLKLRERDLYVVDDESKAH